MRRLWIYGGTLFAINLIIIGVLSDVQHQQSPPPYWLLYDTAQDDHQTLYLSSPDGHLSKPVLHIQRPANLIPLDWLTDESFLYQTNSPEEGYQLRSFNLRSAQSTMIVESLTPNSGPRWQILPQNSLNHTEWRLMLLRSDDGQAVYRINRDATIVERITPYHATIDANNTHMTTDGEWLFYQASDGGNLPNGLFRQRLDGTDNLELFRFEGSLLALSLGDGIYLYVSNFSAPQSSQSRNYEVRVDGSEVDVTETDADARDALFGTTFESGWSVFNDFTGTLGPPGQLYRQHRDGGDPELLLSEDQRQIFTSYPDETIIYIEQHGNFDVLNSVDVPTLTHTQLTPDDRFSDFRILAWLNNPGSLIFEAVENSQQAIYRINVNSADLEQLMAFEHLNQTRYHEFNYRGNWILLSDTAGLPPDTTTTMYRLNINTAEWHELATFSYDASHIFAINSPDPTMFILSAPNNNTAIREQVYVNLADGVSRPVNFGRNVIFGEFQPRQSNTTLLLGIAVAIFALSALARLIESRRQVTHTSI